MYIDDLALKFRLAGGIEGAAGRKGSMTIVIPVAGEGRRFQTAGFQKPKMLIETGNKPMLYWALDSLQPIITTQDVIFLCLAEHLRNYPLEEVIYAYCPHAQIITLNNPTLGQAETVLAAKAYLNAKEPLLIYNCDTYMNMKLEVLLQSQGCDGIIPVFQSQDPRLSYVETDLQGRALQVIEKEVISTYATTGLYHFSRSELFVQAAEAAIREGRRVNGEYYVAPLYNDLIHKGHTFRIEPVDCCYPIGTPDQWRQFQTVIENRRREKGEV